MNWTPILIIAGIFIVFMLLKRAGQISSQTARAHLKNGALVIDVRTPGEFNSGHLTQAINIPLDEIASALPNRVKNKNQVLLLHCASGMCSGVAAARLKGLGYAQSFNLGSYGRAEKVLNSAR